MRDAIVIILLAFGGQVNADKLADPVDNLIDRLVYKFIDSKFGQMRKTTLGRSHLGQSIPRTRFSLPAPRSPLPVTHSWIPDPRSAVEARIQGTRGVASRVAAGEATSAGPVIWDKADEKKLEEWEALQLVDESAKLSKSSFPIKPDDLIKKAKIFLAYDMGVSKPDILSEDFEFTGPVVGPLAKTTYLNAVGGLDLRFNFTEAFPHANNAFHHFRVDPFMPSRVWFTAKGRGTNAVSSPASAPQSGKFDANPPQACSVRFDPDGKVNQYTIGFHLDRPVGESGVSLASESSIRIDDIQDECRLKVYSTAKPDAEVVAIIKGDVEGKSKVPVRVHSECFTGDILGSQRCDCGQQLHRYLQIMDKLPYGILIYVRGHEGRGIGLANKIKAYRLMDDEGLDTVDANLRLGFDVDERCYKESLAALRLIGVKSISLYTNNPLKMKDFGDIVEEVTALPSDPSPINLGYLQTKIDKCGHSTVLKPKECDPRFDHQDECPVDLAALNGISASSFLWGFSAASIGFSLFFLVRVRASSTTVAQPLLG